MRDPDRAAPGSPGAAPGSPGAAPGSPGAAPGSPGAALGSHRERGEAGSLQGPGAAGSHQELGASARPGEAGSRPAVRGPGVVGSLLLEVAAARGSRLPPAGGQNQVVARPREEVARSLAGGRHRREAQCPAAGRQAEARLAEGRSRPVGALPEAARNRLRAVGRSRVVAHRGVARNPAAVHPEAVHPEAVHPEARNQAARNQAAERPEVRTPEAVHPEAVHPEAGHPAVRTRGAAHLAARTRGAAQLVAARSLEVGLQIREAAGPLAEGQSPLAVRAVERRLEALGTPSNSGHQVGWEHRNAHSSSYRSASSAVARIR